MIALVTRPCKCSRHTPLTAAVGRAWPQGGSAALEGGSLGVGQEEDQVLGAEVANPSQGQSESAPCLRRQVRSIRDVFKGRMRNYTFLSTKMNVD